jgi:site-specific DNA recombinase
VKGIIHEPGAKPAMKPESRDALLIAIAKARGWIDDIRLGRLASFAEIAEREAHCERHIRLLAPIAFLSPRIIAAIVDGTAGGSDGHEPPQSLVLFLDRAGAEVGTPF